MRSVTMPRRSLPVIARAGGASEVGVQAGESQDLLDSCVDCVPSWRQSGGRWRSVSRPQAAYGYDIRRGSNGIWHATGILLSR